jgi:hypothetical protein
MDLLTYESLVIEAPMTPIRTNRAVWHVGCYDAFQRGCYQLSEEHYETVRDIWLSFIELATPDSSVDADGTGVVRCCLCKGALWTF